MAWVNGKFNPKMLFPRHATILSLNNHYKSSRKKDPCTDFRIYLIDNRQL